MKRSAGAEGPRGLLVGLVIIVASALAACGGESAVFPRDGAADVPQDSGGAGHGGTAGGGEAGTAGTAGSDGGAADLSSSDAPLDQTSDQTVDGVSCSNDTDCMTSQFCSARACAPRFGNLAGNGDVEYGSIAGWYGVFGGGGTLLVSDTTAAGYAHGGRYSAQATFRSQLYHGPAYKLPTGPGKYILSGWAFQKDDSSVGVNLQVSIACATTTQYFAPTSAPVSQNVWTSFAAIVDTAAMATTPAGDCLATGTTPGGVKLSRVFINQSVDPLPDAAAVAFPDLFLDDLVVQVTDGHNLVGNSNFEGAFTDGWTGGGGTVTVSSALAKTGTHSLVVSGRTVPTAGPSYALPLGAARYSVVFQGLHTGTSPHGLVLQASYTCLGGSPTLAGPIATVAAVATSTWTQLSGTVALPPADAPAGCRLTDASVYLRQAETGTCGGGIECPDLFVDDVSVVIPP